MKIMFDIMYAITFCCFISPMKKFLAEFVLNYSIICMAISSLKFSGYINVLCFTKHFMDSNPINTMVPYGWSYIAKIQ